MSASGSSKHSPLDVIPSPGESASTDLSTAHRDSPVDEVTREPFTCSDCFLLKKQNAGMQIPFFLSTEEELAKIRPPVVVQTWAERYEALTPEQRKTFDKFRRHVKRKTWYDATFYTDWVLIRYLTAREFSLEKAMEQLEKTVEWRKNPENCATTCSMCEENPNLHCGQFVGWDLLHRPVMFMSMRWGPERKHPLKHMMAMYYHMERLMPVGVEKWVCMTDFETYSHLKDSNPSMGISVIQAMQLHFPERLGKMILVNPPSVFSFLWKLFSPVIDPPTKEKVEIVYTDSSPSIYDSFPNLFPEHLCHYLYDSYERSKYCLMPDTLIWTPSDEPYPKCYAERKEQLKRNKGSLVERKKASKELLKEQKKK